MKSIYLLALLPLSLITTGASGVTYGTPHTFIGSFNVEAPIGSKLTVDYPDGFGAMRLSAGEVMTEDMIGSGYYLYNNTTPNAVTFQTGVLNNDFTFNTAVVNASIFKFPMYVYKGRYKKPGTADFQAALLKTSFASGSGLSGKTAVLTFDVPSENRQGGKSLTLSTIAVNGVSMLLSKSDDSTKRILFSFQMLCAKHPTTSVGTKGTSAACLSSEFGPYSGPRGATNKYKMSLLGTRGKLLP